MHSPLAIVANGGGRWYPACINMPARVSGSTPSSPVKTEVLTVPQSSASPNTSHPRTEDNTKDMNPLGVLRELLSSRNLSARPNKLSTSTIRFLYSALKRRSRLRCLTSKQLTELLCLLGSLSLQAPRSPCIYLSKRISYVAEPSFQTHWPFVLEIARDKERLGYALSGTDRYWIMRAQLVKVVTADDEKLRSGKPVPREAFDEVEYPTGDPRLHALSQAAVQYLRIWRHSSDPEIHLPYFNTLLSLRSPAHISKLVQRLCKVLELHANPHSRFLDVLCQVLMRHGHALQFEDRDRLLDMISTRLSRFSDVLLRGTSISVAVEGSEEIMGISKLTAVEVQDLNLAMGDAIFSCYSATTRSWPLGIRQWAVTQATNAFSSAVSMETRWGNLLLLAIFKMPETYARGVSPLESTYPNTGVVNWRTCFVLAMLKKTLTGMSSESESSFQQDIMNIIRPLWRMWKAIRVDDIQRSKIITRAIVAGFFRISALARDTPLKDACYRFCVTHHLFVICDADNDAEKFQTRNLMVAYILAGVSCEGKRWPIIFSTLNSVSPGIDWQDDVMVALLQHYIPQEAETALGLYRYGKHDFYFPPDIVHALGISLATPHAWETALPFLHHSQLSRNQTEELLCAILRVFQVECRVYIDPTVAENLGQVLLKLYTDRPPLRRYKYPIRCFFSIMIASGHAAKAIDVIEVIHRHAPLFFTTRLFLRLSRALIRFRQLHLTARLFRLVPPLPTRASDDLRRKLTLGLAEAGASLSARKVYRTGIRRHAWRTTRESLVRAVHFRTRAPSPYHALRVVPILERNLSHGPSLKYAMNILVRARRVRAAIKLLGRTYHSLDTATKASICNIIIHGRLFRPGVRNGRLVRSVLRTKELLEKQFNFVSDRTTINIILKSILRWRTMIDPPKLKGLFDHMIRIGYPASSRWRKQGDVPFGTSLSSDNFTLQKLPSAISFERHVRPMYKMFIKAFYVRHDVKAARTVVGILKEEEAVAMREREDNAKARRLGLVRKKSREKEKNSKFR